MKKRLLPILVTTAAVALYLPNLGMDELDFEEGRRAIPAREMVANHRFLVPTIWGEPYLNKPPLYFWEIAALANLTGSVDPWTARFPAFLATLATALALFFFGARWVAASAGTLAALLFLVCLAVFKKGAQADLESTLAFTVLVHLCLLWRGRRGSIPLLLAAGVALAAGMLVKGPVVLAFHGAALFAIMREEKAFRLRLILPVIAGSALCAAWLIPAYGSIGWDALDNTLYAQVLRGHGDSFVQYLADRGAFLTGVVFGFFPCSFLAATLLGHRATASPNRHPLAGYLATIIFLSAAFLFLYPGTRARYAYPLLAPSCLAVGALLSGYLHDEDLRRRIRWLAGFAALLGIGLFLAAVLVHVRPYREVSGFSPIGYVLLAILGFFTLSAFYACRNRSMPLLLGLAFSILAQIRLFQVVALLPALADTKGHIAQAKALEANIPKYETVRVMIRGDYNRLYYLDRRLTAEPGPIQKRHLVLVGEHRLAQLMEETALEISILHRTESWQNGQILLVRMLDRGEAKDRKISD